MVLNVKAFVWLIMTIKRMNGQVNKVIEKPLSYLLIGVCFLQRGQKQDLRKIPLKPSFLRYLRSFVVHYSVTCA